MDNKKQRDFVRDLRINNSMRYSANRLPTIFQNIDHLLNVNAYNKLGDASKSEKRWSALKNTILIALSVFGIVALFSVKLTALLFTGKWK